MRYDCDDPAFAGDFIEYSDSWSRVQVREIWKTDNESALLDCLRPKILGLHLTCVDAPPIIDLADLTPERTEQMDTRLYEWFASSWVKHLGNLAMLGNALGRKLFDLSAMSPVGETATATTTTARHRSRKR